MSVWYRRLYYTEIWDDVMKNASAGYVFTCTITDDSKFGGPV